MRVLVTGIDGFVGSHMAEFLLRQDGIEVHGTVFDPRESRLIRHLEGRLHLHRADILDGQAVDAIVRSIEPERIIHLAGQAFIPTSIADPGNTFRTNVMGGVMILEAARKLGAARGRGPAVVIVSSGEVYGRVEASLQPMIEDMPLRPTNPYAASKAAIDLIGQEYRRTFGVDVIVVRPFNHAGPRQSPVFVCSDFGRQFAEFALGRKPARMLVGNLDPRRDFTDVRDVVRAYWMVFDRRTDEALFNVCSGASVPIREVVSILEELSGVHPEILQDERRARANEVMVITGSPEKLRRATAWTPRYNLRQTLADVFAYWKETLAATS